MTTRSHTQIFVDVVTCMGEYYLSTYYYKRMRLLTRFCGNDILLDYEYILRLEPGNKQAKAELEEVRIFINGSYQRHYNMMHQCMGSYSYNIALDVM